jgi:uncharacterized protein
MLNIKKYRYQPASFYEIKKSQFGSDWPVVYLLENGKEIYIGETVSAYARFKQHYENPERKKLTNAYIISDLEYNKSAALDIESSLIQYVSADEKYTIQNSNAGLLNHNYYDREKYQAKFELIWRKLQDLGIAKNNLVQIKNTDLFKYSPYKALTEEQITIVETIHNEFANKKHHTHIINGQPGTGKSVLAVYLAKYIKASQLTQNTSIALIIPMSALRKTLKKVFSKVKGLNSNMVIGPTEVVGKHFDLLIVDEAHRLRRRVNLSSYGPFDQANRHFQLGKNGTQLDWIMKSSDSQVFLYDKNQTIVPGDIRPEDIQSIGAWQHNLTSQLRVLAGEDYISFIDNLLTVRQARIPTFENYDLRYIKDTKELVAEIKQLDKIHGLARLVAGYAWTWESKKGGQDYDIELDGLKLKWNSTNIDWVNSADAINEVGCIHTVQGYDLNYVGVIIGPEVTYDNKLKRIQVDRKKYMDFNGKRSVESDDELETYIINIYKTLLTRGIKGTLIHAVDKSLEQYLMARLPCKAGLT